MGTRTRRIFGNGLVITAQHVVGSAARTKPSVRIAGMDLPAHAIREGSFERVDLTLLSIDEHKLPIYLQMRRMPLCEKAPWPGERVVVAVPEGTARSHVMSPQLLPFNMRRRHPTVISDVGDHRKFRVGRVRCREQMPARHHEPENLRASEPRRSRKQGKRYRQIFCAGIDCSRLHTNRLSLLTCEPSSTSLKTN